MKIKLTETLKIRLENSAFNGSIIAKMILKEIKTGKDISDIIKGKYNYFGTKISKSHWDEDIYTNGIIITACNKDLTNPKFPDYKNPNAAWKKTNRTDIKVSTFVSFFKNISGYTDEDLQFFENSLSVNSKILIRKLDKEIGFSLAYDQQYYPSIIQNSRECSLWNSCMRKEPYCNIAADFYGNLCKAKVIIAQDMNGYTYGRAILWENVESNLGIISFLDRIYYTHDFVYKMIQNYAKKIGVNLRKRENSYESQRDFTILNIPNRVAGENLNLTVYKKIRFSKWYKFGVPYMDTLDKLIIRNGNLYLSNTNGSHMMDIKNTSGKAVSNYSICPICGEARSCTINVCKGCSEKYQKINEFGTYWDYDFIKFYDIYVPKKLCFTSNKPKKNLNNWLITELMSRTSEFKNTNDSYEFVNPIVNPNPSENPTPVNDVLSYEGEFVSINLNGVIGEVFNDQHLNDIQASNNAINLFTD